MSSHCYRGTLSCLCVLCVLILYVYSHVWGCLCIIDYIMFSLWCPYVSFRFVLVLRVCMLILIIVVASQFCRSLSVS
jgi:hypothetical protein